jgi:hypothetical protein
MGNMVLPLSVVVIVVGALFGIANAILDRNLANRRKWLAVGASVTTIIGGVISWDSQQTATQSQNAKFSDLNRQFATFIQVATQWSNRTNDPEIMARLTKLEGSLTQLRDSPIRSSASKLAKALTAFADERDRSTPGLWGTSMWSATTFGGPTSEQVVSYNRETVRLYDERFPADVAMILDQLSVGAKVDKDLSALATNPAGTPGIRHLAQFLASIATKK